MAKPLITAADGSKGVGGDALFRGVLSSDRLSDDSGRELPAKTRPLALRLDEKSMNP